MTDRTEQKPSETAKDATAENAAADIDANGRIDWHSPQMLARLRRRHAANRRMKFIGLAAILLAAGLLSILVGSLLKSGLPAFRQTFITLEFDLKPELVKPDNMRRGKWRKIVKEGLLRALPEDMRNNRKLKRKVMKIVSRSAPYALRDHVMKNPHLVGRIIPFDVLASDPYDQFNKGLLPEYVGAGERKRPNPKLGGPEVVRAFRVLKEQKRVSLPFNWGLFFNADSRLPEAAGLAGAIVGSFLTLLVTFLISFPTGILAAIYLEEFAPKNRFTDFVEININNLAAVPSVVFGLLGLSLFIGFFGVPRSTPLVGGMVLSLMTLPTIIIATRAALKAVPPSLREAALGVGASHHQMVFHHVLPVAMPGILTGAIIGMAQALGETAPLLLVGMNAFIPDISNMGITEPATALPTQIYSWADSPERGFVSRTAAAILVLLGFLLAMNTLAIWLRQRYSTKW